MVPSSVTHKDEPSFLSKNRKRKEEKGSEVEGDSYK
jgi:hypothetical protein